MANDNTIIVCKFIYLQKYLNVLSLIVIKNIGLKWPGR